MLFISAAEYRRYAALRRVLFEPGVYFNKLIASNDARSRISTDINNARAIDSLDAAHRGFGDPSDETAYRNRPIGGCDTNRIHLLDTPVFGWVANANVDFFFAVVRAVITHKHAVCHELNRGADFCHACTHHCSACAVDFDFPFDAGHRCSVIDIDKPSHVVFQKIANARSFGEERLQLLSRQFNLNLFAHGRALLERNYFRSCAGQVGDSLTVTVFDFEAV